MDVMRMGCKESDDGPPGSLLQERMVRYSGIALASLVTERAVSDVQSGAEPIWDHSSLTFLDSAGLDLFRFERDRAFGSSSFREHYGSWCYPSETSCWSMCKNWRSSTTIYYEERWNLVQVRIQPMELGQHCSAASQTSLDLGRCETRYWSYALSCPTFPIYGTTLGCGDPSGWYDDEPYWGIEIQLGDGSVRYGWFQTWEWVNPRDSLQITAWAYEDSGGPIVVGDTGMVPSPLYPTIQSAIDAASEGDVIRIAPGVHQEAVDFRGKAITLVGDVADPGSVVLDGTGLVDRSVVKMVTGEGADSILRGLTIRNGASGTAFGSVMVGGAIHTLESSPTIEDCVFEMNTAEYGGAVYARKGAPVFRRCVFRDNLADEDGGGFQFSRTEGGVLEDCVFEGNEAGNNGGAIHMFGGNPTLLTLSVSGNIAEIYGGGVSWASTGGPAWLDSVDIHGNAAAAAGALYIAAPSPDLTLSDSVLCGNDPDAVQGDFIDGGGNCESMLCIELDGEIACDDAGCPADYSGNGVVNGTDLGVWLAYAGKPCEPDIPCPGDLDGDGAVTGGDLGFLLSNWGVCE